LASVRPHGKGWQVRAWVPTEQRSRAITFTGERDAKRYAKLVEAVGWADAEKALSVADPTTTPTLREAAAKVIALKTGIKAGTRRGDRELVETWGPLLELPITVITREHIANWVNAQAAAGYARSTIANRHSLLSQVLAAAVEDGHLPGNPARGIRLPRTPVEDGVMLTRAQARAILDHLDPWWHPLVLTMLGTGLRYGEVGALQWQDVRLDDAPAAIHVTRAWETPAGEGRGRILGTPKTRRSRRVVTLDSGGLVDVLRAHRDATGGGPGDWVFTGQRGGPVGNNFRERTWRKAVEAALPGLTPRPTPHDCRHTHASWLIAAGVPLVVVQRRLGHESIQTTADRYGHLAPESYALGAAAADAAVTEILGEIEPSAREDR
jgi:integrase